MNETLRSFFTGPIIEKALFKYPQGPFLEIGCGAYPVLPELISMLGPVDCLDHSRSAIEECKKKFLDANFFEADLLDFMAPSKYSIILDAHLMHCLGSLEDYKRALRNIFISLKPGGVFLLETMISHSKMSFELNLTYNTNNFCLYKGDKVSRVILPSIKIEELLKTTGFEVEYLRVSEGMRMIPHDSREESILEDPMVLRLIASVPSSL